MFQQLFDLELLNNYPLGISWWALKGTATLTISMFYQKELYKPWTYHKNRLKNGEVMGI